MEEDNTLVSVYITTHNRSEKLKTALDSVISQTYKNIEIIISDDGSSDDTPLVAQKYVNNHNNIVYVRNEIPKGANSARNLALRCAKGQFITGLDDDDYFEPNRVEMFIEHWDETYSCLCDNFINIYSDGNKKKNYDRESSICLFNMLFKNSCSNQVFTLTERLRRIGGFNEGVKRLQDWDCWLRLVHEYGDAYRMNNLTYVMMHDCEIRVSNNATFSESYMNLVRSNINIYQDFFSNDFIFKYILNERKISYWDVFKLRRKEEVKCFLRTMLRSFKSQK